MESLQACLHTAMLSSSGDCLYSLKHADALWCFHILSSKRTKNNCTCPQNMDGIWSLKYLQFQEIPFRIAKMTGVGRQSYVSIKPLLSTYYSLIYYTK